MDRRESPLEGVQLWRPLLLAAACLTFGVTACGSSSSVASHSSSPEAVASPSATAGFDSCLVGSWKMTSIKITDISGETNLTGGAGATLKVSSDATATLNFDASSPITGTSGAGPNYSGSYKGLMTLTLHTASGKLTLTPTGGDATLTNTFNGVAQGTVPLVLSSDVSIPYDYTCSASSLTISQTANGGAETQTYTRS